MIHTIRNLLFFLEQMRHNVDALSDEDTNIVETEDVFNYANCYRHLDCHFLNIRMNVVKGKREKTR